MTQNLEYQKIQEISEDRDSEIFDTILLNQPVETMRNKLKLLRDQGTDMQDIYRSFFHHFSIDQNLNCPEFLNWCATSYSSSERVIMDTSKSKIPCLVIPLVVRKTLSVPIEFNQRAKEYNEEGIVQCFREEANENKEVFFKSCFKPDAHLKHYPFLVEANEFYEETQCVITLMSHFLGMYIDKYVTKSLMIYCSP